MSTVTIYCRDGACNVEGHTRDNCYNRYAATDTAPLGRAGWELTRPLWSPAELAAFLRYADQQDSTERSIRL